MKKITIEIPVSLLVGFSSVLLFAAIFSGFIDNTPLILFLSMSAGMIMGIIHSFLDKKTIEFPENNDPYLGISKFAFQRHYVNNKGRSYTTLSPEALITLVKDNWNFAIPGNGEKDLTRKILIPIPECLHEHFHCPTIKLKKGMKLKSKVSQRQKGEDLYVSTFLKKGLFDSYEPESPKSVKIVCYSKEALLENNGERSTNSEWEIVSIICSAEENEPMYPLTLARNYLEKPGGTYGDYSAKEFAESIYYWSQRCSSE